MKQPFRCYINNNQCLALGSCLYKRFLMLAQMNPKNACSLSFINTLEKFLY